jgi:hypothetical protein
MIASFREYLHQVRTAKSALQSLTSVSRDVIGSNGLRVFPSRNNFPGLVLFRSLARADVRPNVNGRELGPANLSQGIALGSSQRLTLPRRQPGREGSHLASVSCNR